MTGANWSDLRPRLISAALMIAVGASEIWLGGLSFRILVALLAGVMLWELARMTSPEKQKTPIALGLIGIACLLVALLSPRDIGAALLLVPAVCFALTVASERRIATGWAAAVMIACYGLIVLRNEAGTTAIFWVVFVVIASDVMGYFVGRTIGGPKFWPAISPKKTWSGTVAGWGGAVGVGAVFMAMGHADWTILLLSPVIALAGQMGDIAESWIKRRTGVKDSSHLIPGHGGVLDRFDAMTGAVVALMLLDLLISLPLPNYTLAGH